MICYLNVIVVSYSYAFSKPTGTIEQRCYFIPDDRLCRLLRENRIHSFVKKIVFFNTNIIVRVKMFNPINTFR